MENTETKKAEIVKGGSNFYYCSECKNASNTPLGIPHAATCSLPDQYAKKINTGEAE
jgi:hypothetical protein